MNHKIAALLTVLLLASLFAEGLSNSKNAANQNRTALAIKVRRTVSRGVADTVSESYNPKFEAISDLKFYLLDDDLENILYDAGLRRDDRIPPIMTLGQKSTYGLAETFGTSESSLTSW